MNYVYMKDIIFVQEIIDILTVYKDLEDFTNLHIDLINGCKDSSTTYVREWINTEDNNIDTSNYEPKFQEVGFKLDCVVRELSAWYEDFEKSATKNQYILDTINALEVV